MTETFKNFIAGAWVAPTTGAYFENRNWNVVWNSEAVKSKWRELWLSKNSDNTFAVHQWFDVEKPTIPHLDAGLELYARCASLEVLS